MKSLSLSKVFDEFRSQYIQILRFLYPAKNSTGFTERNLSVNFAHAYEKLNPASVCWYEFQFGNRNNLHLDAVLLDYEKKVIFLIESKRFSNPKDKTKEIRNDVIRLHQIKTEYDAEFAERIEHYREYDLYGVILADIWTETPKKCAIQEAFSNASFFKSGLFVEENEDFAERYFQNGEYYVRDFHGATRYKWVNEQYYLLSAVWKIR